MDRRRKWTLIILLLIAILIQPIHSKLQQQPSESPQCERVFEKSDSCDYARKYCLEESSWLNYVVDYYCVSSWLIISYLLMLVGLFVFIGTAAGDYFCPNLNTIAQYLGLSENLTGVTFLALGNGAPDLFASFGAIQQGSYGLAIGELLGAGSFITTCVVGAVAIVSGFKVTRRPFIRDVIFFLVSVIVLLVILFDEKIVLLESVILICLYITYVLVVGIGRAMYHRQKRKRLERHRFHQTIAETSGENALIEEADNEFVRMQNEESKLLHDSEYAEGIEEAVSIDVPPISPAAQSIFLSPGLLANHYDPWFFKHKTLTSLHHGYINQSRIRNADSSSLRVRFRSSPSIITDYESGGSRRDSSEVLLDDLGDDRSISTRRKSSGEEESLVDIRELEKKTESAVTVSLSSRPSIITSTSSTPRMQTVANLPPKSWNQIRHELYESFPTTRNFFLAIWPFLDTWHDQKINERILSILSIPSNLFLCLTVPVVDSTIEVEPTTILTIQNADEDNAALLKPVWNRWLFILHSITVPLFIIVGFGKWADPLFNGASFITWGLLACMASIACFMATLKFTSPYKIPKYHTAMCLVGFVCAILWIYHIAQELLVILQSVGIILHVSEAILGLTVLAIGNSLADLVADVTIAKMGFPNMAIAACFGGPMLNILLGVGVSTLYYNLTHHESYHLKFTRTLFMSGIGLVISLSSSLIVIPMNKWRGTKSFGLFLIGVYILLMIINILIEIFNSPSS